MVGVVAIAAFLDSYHLLNTPAETALAFLATVTLPLNLGGIAGLFAAAAAREAWAWNPDQFPVLAFAYCSYWIAEFLFLTWLRSLARNAEPVRLSLR